jgi:hypothetical protein
VNFVLPDHHTPALERRAAGVLAEVQGEVQGWESECPEHTGFLTRSGPDGKTWVHLEGGRCRWLLTVQGYAGRVIFYRRQGDAEEFELSLPAHGGGNLCQKVVLRALGTRQYSCRADCQIAELDRRVRWFQVQRWVQSARDLMKMRRPSAKKA